MNNRNLITDSIRMKEKKTREKASENLTILFLEKRPKFENFEKTKIINLRHCN